MAKMKSSVDAGAVMVLAAYRLVWKAAMPFITWYVKRKDMKNHVLPAITAERFGHVQLPAYWQKHSKDECFTLWIHGASVGECLSALPVIDLVQSDQFLHHLGMCSKWKRKTTARVVVSTTTAAARQLMSDRFAQSNTPCIFAPLDSPENIERFYNTWQPDAGLWIESELWPNLVLEAARRQIRIGIINGRMSEKSFQLWRLPIIRSFARHFLKSFSMVICQNDVNSKRFSTLGANNPETVTNLKFASSWRSCDQQQHEDLNKAIIGRTVWVAGSTHEGEELMMATVHAELSTRLRSGQQQNLLTFLIPRHPTRTKAIIAELQQRFPQLEIALRSRDHLPRPSTSVFIVDTMGETEIFYAAIPTVVIGGTFVKQGGHNPIEPLRTGCKVFVGPHMHNFEDIVSQLETTQQHHHVTALQHVHDPTELALKLAIHFENGDGISGRSIAVMKMMQSLTLQTRRDYENKICEWLRE